MESEIPPPSTTEFLKDEQDGFSMSRLLLIIWTGLLFYLMIFHLVSLTQPILTFLSSVYLFLVCWAAGPRMVQYLSPIVSQVATAIGQAKSVDISSDIQELKELKNKLKG